MEHRIEALGTILMDSQGTLGGKNDKYNGNRRGMYRSREGMTLGVCQGWAEYFALSVFWVRAGMVLILPLSGFFRG